MITIVDGISRLAIKIGLFSLATRPSAALLDEVIRRSDAATAYKVETEAIATKVKQEFAAKEKAKKAAQPAEKPAKKAA